MSVSNEYWTGNGNMWMDDVEFEKIKSFEAEMEIEWEDVPEGLSTVRVMLGHSYSVKFAYRKTDKNSKVIMEKIFEEYVNGRTPEVKIVGKAYNKATGKTERIEVSGITFDKLTLQKWEEKSVVENEIEAKASKVKILQ